MTVGHVFGVTGQSANGQSCRNDNMSQDRWLKIGVASLLVIFTELAFECALSFSPGWANGWPGGLPISSVWAAGLSFLLFLVLMTAATGTSALILVVSGLRRLSERAKLRMFVFWELLAAIAVTPLVIGAFMALRESASKTWPNGYNP
jgi:hypothetical protein